MCVTLNKCKNRICFRTKRISGLMLINIAHETFLIITAFVRWPKRVNTDTEAAAQHITRNRSDQRSGPGGRVDKEV